MPDRFGLTYTGEDGLDHQPVMIHRAIVGSLERFMGILIEHYAARMPVWLAPIQVKVIPIADRHQDYAQSVVKELRAAGIRVEANWKNEKIGQKIRQAEKDMVFELLKQHLIEDDDELNRIYEEYKAGRMTSAEIKQLACEKITEFMNDFTAKLEKYKRIVKDLNFIKFL